MKIKNQFIISIASFTSVLLIIFTSIAVTEQQVTYLNTQEAISANIERGVSSLDGASIEYFLYQEDLQLSRWETILSYISKNLEALQINSNYQQTLKNNVAKDLQSLNTQFDEVKIYLQNANRNVSVRIDPAFQIRWSNMAVQSQNLAFDASLLSQSIDDQVHQISEINNVLIISFISTFGAFLLIIYFIVFRRTLRGVINLQQGIGIIGTGKLDYAIDAGKEDEIADISKSVNQMAANLRTLTASKADLEKEIEEHKRAERELQQAKNDWENTFNSVPDLIALLDKQHRIIRANQAMVDRLGKKPEQCVGLSCYQCVHGTNMPPEICPHAETLKDGKEHIAEVYEPILGGYFNVSTTPIKDDKGQPIGSIHVARDITERKKAEIELKDRTEQLEQTQKKLEEHACLIEEYANQMEDLAKRRAEQLKDAERLAAIGATAGMVGHDIRNPLQSISFDLYFAKKRVMELPQNTQTQKIIENMNSIESSINYINKIVQDLQDFAKPIKVNKQKTNLDKLIREILLSINMPENISTSYQVDEAVMNLMVDSVAFKRVLTNLVNNAIQAMENGGKLRIRAYLNGDKAVITVADTGVGIPEDVKPKLFVPLMTTKAKGQGFGLAVVKRMVEAQGGTVGFESKVGKGTTFTIQLPLIKEESSS